MYFHSMNGFDLTKWAPHGKYLKLFPSRNEWQQHGIISKGSNPNGKYQTPKVQHWWQLHKIPYPSKWHLFQIMSSSEHTPFCQKNKNNKSEHTPNGSWEPSRCFHAFILLHEAMILDFHICSFFLIPPILVMLMPFSQWWNQKVYLVGGQYLKIKFLGELI